MLAAAGRNRVNGRWRGATGQGHDSTQDRRRTNAGRYVWGLNGKKYQDRSLAAAGLELATATGLEKRRRSGKAR